VLVVRCLERRNPEIVAELLSCMRYLKFQDMKVYRGSISYLLSSQNINGPFTRPCRLEECRE